MTVPPADRPTAKAILDVRRCPRPGCPCVRSAERGRGLTHCPCPAHADLHPSFSVDEREGTVVFHCHTGCPQAAALVALQDLGLWPQRTASGGFQSRQQRRWRERHTQGAVTRWMYEDERGELLAFHCRRDRSDGSKAIWWERPDGTPSKAGTSGAIEPAHLPLYGLGDLLTSPDDVPVLLGEGEKATDAACRSGFIAVSLAGGAGQTEFGTALEPLRRRHVVLVPDRDASGHGLMRRVAASLDRIAASVRWLDLPGLPLKGDVYDFVAAGGTPEQLADLVREVPDASEHLNSGVCALCAEADAAAHATAGGRVLMAVPVFPADLLPEPVRTYVVDAAAAIGCPVDFVAAPLLACAGAVIGNAVAIAPKPDFRLYPVLWVAVIGEPGSAKSPALRAASYPLAVLQQEAYTRYQLAMLQYQRDLAAWQGEKKDSRGPPPTEPRLTHVMTSDATLEALASMIDPPIDEEHPGLQATGVCWVADELAGWVLANNQYKGGKGSDRQRWLSAWASASLKVDRQKRTIYVSDPVICVTGCVQPDVLESLRHEEERRDGFEERPLYVWPDTTVSEWSERSVAPRVKDAVVSLFRALHRSERLTTSVMLTTEAKRLWVRWFNENRRLTAAEHGALAGVYSKLDVQVARLALVLHALAVPDRYETIPVTVETMLAAIELGEYFRVHAHRALARFGVANHGRQGGLAARLLRVLRAHPGEWLSRTALHHELDRNVSAVERDAALEALEADGLAERRIVPPSERGGRPGEEWRACGDASTQERRNAETVDQLVSFCVSAFLPDDDEANPRCRYCTAPLRDSSTACFQCNDRPCADCGEPTGSALRVYCMRCALRGPREAGGDERDSAGMGT